LPYVDTEDFGQVIFILMDGDKPICYHKESVSKFMNPDAKLTWIQMYPDNCVGKVKHINEAGMISVKLSIHNVTKNGPINFKDYPSWKKKLSKRLNPIKIRAYIYQCKDLPAADSNGTSDPFI
jgi:hypothetical protein